MAIMDKELLKKYHLEEAQKRFQQICEYTFITKPLLDEEGEDDDQQPQQNGGQQPPMDNNGGYNQQPPMGDNGQNQQPPMDNGGGDNQPMQGNMPPQQPPMDNGQEGGEDMSIDMEPDNKQGDDNVDTMQDGDEVIDVDELTNAQETAEVKIDGVNDKLQNMLTVMNKFIAAIDNNDKKIDDLRAEFEKRNPSEEEKINIRSQASYPYCDTPRDFWDKKSQDSNYNVIYNNDVDPDKEEEEFVIKKSDVTGNDDRSLAKSLDYPSKLKDFIDF